MVGIEVIHTNSDLMAFGMFIIALLTLIFTFALYHNEEPSLIAPYGSSSNTISIPHILYISYPVMSIFINHYQKYSYGNTIYVSYYHIKTLAKWCKVGVNSNL